MLDLRRLRLLRELARRGTIASVAEALSFSPSAVSQQLATLEKEAGVRLLVENNVLSQRYRERQPRSNAERSSAAPVA